MTSREIAHGWIFGYEPSPRSALADVASGGSPREVLDELLRPCLHAAACHVLFSGGRDSSVVLAAATALARREGLPMPVPVTRVFAQSPESEEARWQTMVCEQLGLDNRVFIAVDDELDALGPISQEGLLAHGVVYPPTAFAQRFTFGRLAGSTVVTGEGGDEVFGAQRITPLAALVQRKRRPSKALLQAAASAVAPAPLRGLAGRRDLGIERDWLTPAARREAQRLARADALAQPLWWSNGVRHLLMHRGSRIGMANLSAVAAGAGVDLVHPLLDPAFVESVARWGGRLGPVGRTDALRRLFADLLPDEVLSRTTKARFNASAFNRHAEAFIATWRGVGVDPHMVDADRLRAAWATRLPATLPLLQSAWLASVTTAGAASDTAAGPASTDPPAAADSVVETASAD